MKINQDLIARNLLGEVTLPQCNFFRKEAENIVAMLLEIPPFDYDSTAEFQKHLIIEYWRYYDGLDKALNQYPQFDRYVVFSQWFVKTATPPENIRRASQWLASPEPPPKGSGGILTLKTAVREKSLERAEGIRVGKGG
jgi:hypothetical protein